MDRADECSDWDARTIDLDLKDVEVWLLASAVVLPTRSLVFLKSAAFAFFFLADDPMMFVVASDL